MAMWDWVGYVDPDFMLSVVTKGQWCSWSDTGWDNPEYDALYDKQGTTIDPEEREQIVWQMQKMIYDNFIYTQLVNLDVHRGPHEGVGRLLAGARCVLEEVLHGAAQGGLGKSVRRSVRDRP